MQVLGVSTHGKKNRQKGVRKNGLGIENFGIDQFEVELELIKWN